MQRVRKAERLIRSRMEVRIVDGVETLEDYLCHDMVSVSRLLYTLPVCHGIVRQKRLSSIQVRCVGLVRH